LDLLKFVRRDHKCWQIVARIAESKPYTLYFTDLRGKHLPLMYILLHEIIIASLFRWLLCEWVENIQFINDFSKELFNFIIAARYVRNEQFDANIRRFRSSIPRQEGFQKVVRVWPIPRMGTIVFENRHDQNSVVCVVTVGTRYTLPYVGYKFHLQKVYEIYLSFIKASSLKILTRFARQTIIFDKILVIHTQTQEYILNWSMYLRMWREKYRKLTRVWRFHSVDQFRSE
jgi:hypothetical protein